MDEDVTIAITATAKSKAFRLLSVYQIRDVVGRALDGRSNQVYRKGDTNEFHVIYQQYAVVVKMENDDGSPGMDNAVVVTQMHTHPDYDGEDIYLPVDSLRDLPG